jgi:hypothetical protein
MFTHDPLRLHTCPASLPNREREDATERRSRCLGW